MKVPVSNSDRINILGKLFPILIKSEINDLSKIQSSIKESIHVYSLEAGDCAYPNEELDANYVCYIQKGSVRSIFQKSTGEEIGITKIPRGYVLGVYEALISNTKSSYVASTNCECIYIDIKELIKAVAELITSVKFDESRIPLQLFWLHLYEINCKNTRDWCSLPEKLSREIIKTGLVANLTPPEIEFFFDISDYEDPKSSKLNQHGQITNDQELAQILKNYPQENFGTNNEIYQAKIRKESIIKNFSFLSNEIKEYLRQSSDYDDEINSEAIPDEMQAKSTKEEVDPDVEHRVFGLNELHFSQKISAYKEWQIEKFLEEIAVSFSSFLSVKHYREAIRQEINKICSENKIYGELRKINRLNDDKIISRVKAFHFALKVIFEELGITASISVVQSNDMDEIEFPAIIFDNMGFPVVIWKCKNDQYLASVTNANLKGNLMSLSSMGIGQESLCIEVEKINRNIESSLNSKRQTVLDLILPRIKKYKKELVVVIVSSFIAQLLAISIPLTIQRIVDAVINQGNLSALTIFGSTLIFIALLEGLISTARSILFTRTANQIDINIGLRVISKLMSLPYSYFSKRGIGETAARINEVENIRSFLTGSGITAILDSAFVVIYVSIMLNYNVNLPLITLSLVPAIVLVTVFISPMIRTLMRKEAVENAKVQSHLVESLTAIETVKAAQFEWEVMSKWKSLYSKEISFGYKKNIIATSAGQICEFLEQVSGLIAIWYGAYLVIGGSLSIGQLFAFRILAGYVTGPIVRISSIWNNFQQAMLSYERLSDIVLRQSEEQQDLDKCHLNEKIQSIEFKNICFSYVTDSATLNLSDVSFSTENHRFTSIVGESGSGKSTILKLITRLYVENKGLILINGKNAANYSISSIRRGIMHVTQDSLLFDASIKDNLLLGGYPYSDKDISDALKIACVDEFLDKLENGINFKIGERGLSLSGGQRQRVGLARALIKRPSLLLLDEATSALDEATEKQIFENIRKFLPDTRVISVSHRLKSVDTFSDHVLIISDGIIVDSGSPNDLNENSAHYKFLKKSTIT